MKSMMKELVREMVPVIVDLVLTLSTVKILAMNIAYSEHVKC
jgi:hypothetical protein